MESKVKTRIILFLLVVIIALLGLPQAFAVDFKKDVQLEVIPGSVYYVFKTNVSIPSISIVDETLILDGTDVLDFQPGAGRLTITIYDWSSTSNSLGIKNTVGETTFFTIKESGATRFLVENGLYHESSVETSTSEFFWEYKPAAPSNPIGGGGGGGSPAVTTTNNSIIRSSGVFTEGFLARKLFEFRLPLKTTSGELEKTFSIRSWMLFLTAVIILALIVVNIIRNSQASRRYGE